MAAADDPHRIALVLTGGGARAAYQVGVLQAVSDLLGRPRANPFPIVCGTSAGAINAAALAIGADDFGRAVTWLVDEWRSFHAERVYRTDLASLARLAMRWLRALAQLSRNDPISLLDNTPLRELVENTLDLDRIATNIASGALEAISISASGYASGRSVAFYQGRPQHAGWERSHRVGIAAPITHDVLMASTAIPFLFPAVKVDAEHYGDGSMRQIAPVSPALHLGASRVLVVANGRRPGELPPRREAAYPSLAQIAGHALNSIFLDTLAVDLERLHRINRTIALLDPGELREAGVSLRHVDVFVIYPSEPIDMIAARHVAALPRSIRVLLRAVGATRRNGSNLASYLLFEAPFCRDLIDLGYRDTMRRRAELGAFFAGGAGESGPEVAADVRLRASC